MATKTLKLHLLGPPLIELDGEQVEGFVSAKALALLGFLVVQQGNLRRERLADLFWGDMNSVRARANLRMAIYNLQHLFPGRLKVNRSSAAFDRRSDYWLDVEQFERLLAGDPQMLAHSTEPLKLALSLYRGEFMQEVDPGGSPDLEDWLLVERERMRQLALEGLQRYARVLMQARQYSTAVQTLRRLLRLDPWQEIAHQQLMLALARRGDYTAALAQYEICRRLLVNELGVEPMPETTRLYERIRAARALPFRHNLPFPHTPFIGREAELHELSALLSDPSRRLITLTGPGGVGKSRLALQAATDLKEAFLHGVYLVPLDSLSSVKDLPAAVGNALGLHFARGEPPKQQLLRYLQEKELLLVLDNCERLPAMVDFVDKVLEAAAGTKILATSRKRLGLVEEWLLEVK